MSKDNNESQSKPQTEFEKSKSPIFKENIIYKPFTYPWAEEMRKKHEKIHWLPDEIPMGKDVNQWNRNIITQQEKQFVKNILKLFTEMDAIVGRNYKRNFIPVFRNNEISNLMTSFSNRESLHAEAYALINDTIGLPDTEYAEFLKYKELSEKVDYAMDSDNSTIRGVALALAKSVFNEGVSLFSSFVMLLNFQRTGKMMGMCKVVEWSIRDECLTLDTEVLTLDGWKTIDKVGVGDTILQWDTTTQKLSFEKIHTVKDVERLETIHYTDAKKSFVQTVSDGHRMIIEKDGEITESTGGKLNVNEDFNFITTGKKDGGEFVFDDSFKNKVKIAKTKGTSLDWLYEIMDVISSEQANEILEYYNAV